MNQPTTMDACALAAWNSKLLSTRAYPLLTIYYRPETPNHQPMTRSYVPEFPLLRRDANQKPVFALTLFLSRQPEPGSTSLQALIERGLLNLEVTLAVPEAALQLAAGDEDVLYQPLFAREATFSLTQPDDAGVEAPLGSASGSGAGATAALQAELTRDQVLDVLGALEGVPSSLKLCAQVRYQLPGQQQTVHLTGMWTDIYDFLNAQPVAADGFTTETLREHFGKLIAGGYISVNIIAADGSESPAEQLNLASLFTLFARMGIVILRQEGDRYYLRTRPYANFPLDLRQTVTDAQQTCVSICGRLDQIISGALQNEERAAYITTVTLNSNGAGYAPVHRRVRIARTSVSRRNGAATLTAALPLATWNKETLQALPAALQPTVVTQTNLHAVLDSDLVYTKPVVKPVVNPLPEVAVNEWWLNDILIEKGAKAQHLPVVTNAGAPLWADRVNSNQYWYAPIFELTAPAPNADPESSPFSFTYERTGATASGEVGLRATVRLTLRSGMSDATKRRLQELGNPTAYPVPMDALVLSLIIPFVDDRDGQTKENAFPLKVEQTGAQWIASVELLNNWVRLSYGALATPNFQQRPPRLQVLYRYQAYVPTKQTDYEMYFGGKSALLPVKYWPEQKIDWVKRPYLDATTQTYHLPAGELKFAREELQLVNGRNGANQVEQKRAANLATLDTTTLGVKDWQLGVLARPELTTAYRPIDILPETQYARQTLLREQSLDALYPCNTLGAFYREKSDGKSTAIGCRDALQLGRTLFRLYEEISELRHDLYRVYRSLPQAGSFLVVPTYYRIGRYEATDDKAYRPQIMINAVLDAATPANNHFVFNLSLQPDLPYYERKALAQRLLTYAQAPIIQYPTEIAAQALEYEWTLPTGINAETLKMPDSFQVALQADLANALLLQSTLQTSGIFGRVRFQLPDGTTLESALALELRRITGPWRTGPLQLSQSNQGVTITNRIEAPIAVHALMVETVTDAHTDTQAVAVEATLARGAATTAPPQSAGAEIYPVYQVQPGTTATIDEVRTFVEDVEINLIFLSVINYANHNLQRLEVAVRLPDVAGAQAKAIDGATALAEFRLLRPVTTYLTNHTIQFQVTKVLQNGQRGTTAWFTWDVEANGALVTLTWEGIQ
ncbi:MAG: hypothetical protein R3C14_53160 [Caldilineaceae bacterium]